MSALRPSHGGGKREFRKQCRLQELDAVSMLPVLLVLVSNLTGISVPHTRCGRLSESAVPITRPHGWVVFRPSSTDAFCPVG